MLSRHGCRAGTSRLRRGGRQRRPPRAPDGGPAVPRGRRCRARAPHGILEQPFDQRLRLVASGAVQHGAGGWAFPWLPRREEALDVFLGGLRLLALELGRKVPLPGPRTKQSCGRPGGQEDFRIEFGLFDGPAGGARMLPSLHSGVGEPMGRVDALDRGRESFRRQQWGDAYAQLSAAGRQVSLEPDDLERFAVAAYLVCGSCDPSVGAVRVPV